MSARSAKRIRRFFERRAPFSHLGDMVREEHAVIRARRAKCKHPNPSGDDDILGVCLSGGGVRSATFNLGVLQALHHYGFLKMVDYLSTVSGGGYIGASLSWFYFRRGRFLFPRFPQRDGDRKAGDWLKSHASYLVPGNGLDTWALVAAVARGIFINLLIFVPLLFAVVFYASYIPDVYQRYVCSATCLPPVFLLALIYATAATIGLALAFVLYAFWSRSRPIAFFRHRRYSVQYGKQFKRIFIASAFGIIPVLGNWLGELQNSINRDTLTLVSSLIGSASILLGWLSRRSGSETKGFRAFAISFGLTLVIYGLFLWFHQISVDLWASPSVAWFGLSSSVHWLIALAMLLSLVLGLTADINHVSMHRYYRDRLLEAYMPDQFKGHRQRWSSDKFTMADIDPETTGSPFHIINTNVTLLDSSQPRYRIRGGDSFVFTPRHCGSKATGGWVSACDYMDGQVDVATAMSISGAAVDPNTGATRSRPLAFIMSFLNVRLGYWIPNPFFASAHGKRPSPWLWHYYVMREMLGWRMDETQPYVHLSDGGHFENLGLYELIRRQCPYIIVCDAGADPNWKFGDLARAIERVRADFRAEVSINTQQLHPDPESRLSQSAFVGGEVRYSDGSVGRLIYLKTAVCPDLPEDIYGYMRSHPQFPDEPTSDQFFGDQQFEAYRELGFRLAEKLFDGRSTRNVAEVFGG